MKGHKRIGHRRGADGNKDDAERIRVPFHIRRAYVCTLTEGTHPTEIYFLFISAVSTRGEKSQTLYRGIDLAAHNHLNLPYNHTDPVKLGVLVLHLNKIIKVGIDACRHHSESSSSVDDGSCSRQDIRGSVKYINSCQTVGIDVGWYSQNI